MKWKNAPSALLALLLSISAFGQGYPSLDLTQPTEAAKWRNTHHTAPLKSSGEGLVIPITGPDPFITGPALDLPENQLLWLNLRLRSDSAGHGQIFYFHDHPSEANSLRFPVRANRWDEVKVPLPALGKGYRLRFDPPGGKGQCVVANMSFEARKVFSPPQFPKPTAPNFGANAPALTSGALSLRHASDSLACEVSVDGTPVAIGFDRQMVSYLVSNEPRWFDLKSAKVTSETAQGRLSIKAVATDPDGATWTLERSFTPGAAGSIEVTSTVSVSAERDVLLLPMFLLSAGGSSFHEHKAQGLFAGLEYLDHDEPSSSEADLTGTQANRLVPDQLKITFPLMAVSAEDRYIALTWKRSDDIAAIFDSPDRTFHSDGHLMGLIFPGSNGQNRPGAEILPAWPTKVQANRPVSAKATILAGKGSSAVEAVKHYLSLNALPPAGKMDEQTYIRQTAAGWLDSKVREGNRFRHAYPGNFGAHPAGDVPVFMDYLAATTSDADLAKRLSDASKGALAEVAPAVYDFSSVGHVRKPVTSLLYGHHVENVALARRQATELLGRFNADGLVLYQPGKIDYGRTHFEKHANGLTAQLVSRQLECAVMAGDEPLITVGIRLLRGLDRYMNTAPRGAQTWEVPLHTPDILASAYLVNSYVLGYQITGERGFLEKAKYWAYTGVPFVYLDEPLHGEAGERRIQTPYQTIAVYGATQWVAPNWMGMPVQWCGMVYADSLYTLAEHDPKGPWKTLAEGITVSGMQQSWPIGLDPEREGLLPDSFMPRTQTRNDAAINPGTVQAVAPRVFNRPPLYTFHAFRQNKLYLHAPGNVSSLNEQRNRVSFRVTPWSKGKFTIAITNCPPKAVAQIDGNNVAAEYNAQERVLIIPMNKTADVAVSLP